MKMALFIVGLLVLIGIGAAVLYKIGEVIVESQDTVCHGEYGRWREYEEAEEDNDGDSH